MITSAPQPHPFRNDTGSPIPPFGLILCREIVKRSADSELFLKAEKPVAAEIAHLYRNGGMEVAPNGYGSCYLGEILEVAYDPGDDEDEPDVGQPWGIKPGSEDSFKLRQGYGGWEVLRKPADDEVQRVLVRRMLCHRLTGEMADTLDAPDDSGWTGATTGDLNLYLPDRTAGGSPATYTDQSRMIVVKGVTNRDTSLSVNPGALVRVEWFNGEWVIVWAGC